MELPLGLQAAQVGAAALTGVALGVLYDALRAMRRRYARLGPVMDAQFALGLAFALLVLTFGAGRGQFRLFFLPAAAAGLAVYFWLLSRLLLHIFCIILSVLEKFVQLVTWPIRWCAKKIKKFLIFLFAILKKWVTMFGKMVAGVVRRHSEGSVKASEICSVVPVGEAGASDRGGVCYCYPGVTAVTDLGEERGGRQPDRQHHRRRAGKRAPTGRH